MFSPQYTSIIISEYRDIIIKVEATTLKYS